MAAPTKTLKDRLNEIITDWETTWVKNPDGTDSNVPKLDTLSTEQLHQLVDFHAFVKANP